LTNILVDKCRIKVYNITLFFFCVYTIAKQKTKKASRTYRRGGSKLKRLKDPSRRHQRGNIRTTKEFVSYCLHDNKSARSTGRNFSAFRNLSRSPGLEISAEIPFFLIFFLIFFLNSKKNQWPIDRVRPAAGPPGIRPIGHLPDLPYGQSGPVSIVGQRRCVDLFIKCNRCNLGEKSAVWASGDARHLDFLIGPIMTFLLRSKSYF
jgi:hypothetical protein